MKPEASAGQVLDHLNWLVESYPSEKYEFVSWDDYSQDMGETKTMFQTTNQVGFQLHPTINGHFPLPCLIAGGYLVFPADHCCFMYLKPQHARAGATPCLPAKSRPSTGTRPCDSLIDGHATGTNLLEIPTMYFWPIFEAYIFEDVPTKYGLKYSTNVPPYLGS